MFGYSELLHYSVTTLGVLFTHWFPTSVKLLPDGAVEACGHTTCFITIVDILLQYIVYCRTKNQLWPKAFNVTVSAK